MGTTQNHYSYFKITAECDKVGDIYEPQLWPDGVFVRRFYEVCKPRTNAGRVNIETSSKVSVVSAPEARAVLKLCEYDVLILK